MKRNIANTFTKIRPGLKFSGVLGAVLFSGIATGILIGQQLAESGVESDREVLLQAEGQFNMQGMFQEPALKETWPDPGYEVAVKVTRSETALKDFQYEEFTSVDETLIDKTLKDYNFDVEAADYFQEPQSIETQKSEKEVAAVAPIDRKEAWQEFAVPVTLLPGRKLISIVIDDLGIDQAHTRSAIELPAPMSMAFIPYGYNLQRHVDNARKAGHEIMVHMPMEPLNRRIDPGPYALKVGLDIDELKKRIEWGLSQFDGYVGVNNHMGSRYTAWDEGMGLVMNALKERELLFLDSYTSRNTIAYKKARSMEVYHDVRDIFLDHEQDRASIDRQLETMMQIAERKGVVIAIGHPHDNTLAALMDWYSKLDQSRYQLIPISKAVELHMRRLKQQNLLIANG